MIDIDNSNFLRQEDSAGWLFRNENENCLYTHIDLLLQELINNTYIITYAIIINDKNKNYINY